MQSYANSPSGKNSVSIGDNLGKAAYLNSIKLRWGWMGAACAAFCLASPVSAGLGLFLAECKYVMATISIASMSKLSLSVFIDMIHQG